MAQGRSLPDFQRIYIGGVDLSGAAFDSGEQGITYPEFEGYAWADAIKGALVGKPTVTFGPLLALFDSTPTTGFHVLESAAQGSLQYILLAQGIRAAPAMGDDTFALPAWLKAYKAVQSGGQSQVSATFSTVDTASAMNYDEYWGKLLHAYGAETGANSANANVDNGAQSTAGGWLIYEISAIGGGAGTATVSIDDSANGTNWLALSGATSGAIAFSAAPTAGIVQLGTTATVRQYLRWQLAFASGANSCTFALAFVRGR